ncbi:hypothetical protein [Actinophytocola glycyrrhizae]|uniref:Uncharacterized protein n=1 Tax=Actinophytocola glycyrrhizae TaxID=2044873 RepID=A0ABV9RUD9_9PSEU
MSWFKVALTRLFIGEIVHLALKVVQPGVHVDHLLVVMSVFVAATVFGVVPGQKAPTSGAGQR